MDRLSKFKKARELCLELSKRFPSDQAIESIVKQLNYLIELEQGNRSDFERLDDIIIDVLATREIDQLDESVGEALGEVMLEVDGMKRQYSRKMR